jgi:uncharacterized protein YijF (DUF1287 family)
MNETLREKALKLGATEFGTSKAKNKRFYVIYKNKIINFGLKGGDTFIDHRDADKRSAWIARHTKIKLKDNSFAYKNKNQPSYWALKILWD